MSRIPLQDSTHPPITRPHVGAPDPQAVIRVAVRVRYPPTAPPLRSLAELGSIPLHERNHLSRAAFAGTHGTAPNDIAKVEAFAHTHNLDVVETSIPKHLVRLSGTVADFRRAFGVDFTCHQDDDVLIRGYTGAITIPAELDGIIDGVFGLEDRPLFHPRFHHAHSADSPTALQSLSYWPTEIAAMYAFPAAYDGSGETIALIEFGGGYEQKELDAYFKALGMPTPDVTWISVDGGKNEPVGEPLSADGEVLLDIEVAGAVAPGAKIVVYFVPRNDILGFADAIQAAIHDQTHAPSIVSISWGSSETHLNGLARLATSQVLKEAANLGVTVCASAGDHGAKNGMPVLTVDYPASDPGVLACGGTTLHAKKKTRRQEVVWNNDNGWATGGGISRLFPKPAYQFKANVPRNPRSRSGRGVPDVAGDADGKTGYHVLVDGTWSASGGTSAVAPLWAGLIARINQALGFRVGFINAHLYRLRESAFNPVTSGNNGHYHAGPGWDPCTGLGTPNGAALLEALSTKQVS